MKKRRTRYLVQHKAAETGVVSLRYGYTNRPVDIGVAVGVAVLMGVGVALGGRVGAAVAFSGGKAHPLETESRSFEGFDRGDCSGSGINIAPGWS